MAYVVSTCLVLEKHEGTYRDLNIISLVQIGDNHFTYLLSFEQIAEGINHLVRSEGLANVQWPDSTFCYPLHRL